MTFSLDRGPATVDELDDCLSTPTPQVVETLSRLTGDLMFLGVGGKMGPTMARMAKRASEQAGLKRRVIGVSRFSSPTARQQLEAWGIETISCDLMDEAAVASLPAVENIVSMTGFKFGASANPSLTWAMNCYLPSLICKKFQRSKIVAFSTGNVYGLVPVASGGSVESDELRPVGEYAITAVGRERMFEYFSRQLQIPMALLRLNYATELRYGVLVDLATQVFRGEPVDISMGYVNVIWQAEANAMALAAFDHLATPPNVINVAGPEILRLRDVAEAYGKRFGKPVHCVGQEATSALLNNGQRGHKLLGQPKVSVATMQRWTADWVAAGGASLGKPTHFQSRDGKF